MKPYPGGVVFSAPSTTIQEPPAPPVRHHYDNVSPAVTSSQSGNFLHAAGLSHGGGASDDGGLGGDDGSDGSVGPKGGV